MFEYKNIEIYPIKITTSLDKKRHVRYITYICNDKKLCILFSYNSNFGFISSNIKVNKKYVITCMKVGYLYILTDLVKTL